MFLKCFVIFLRLVDEVYVVFIFDEFSFDDECIIEVEKFVLFSVVEVEYIEVNITLREIFYNFLLVIIDFDICKFNISRNYIWEGVKRVFNRKLFNFQNKLFVKFIDDMGILEGVVDFGGLVREFFIFVIERLVNFQFFFGEVIFKFLFFNVKCLEEREYYLVGQVFVMLLVYGGFILKCFSDLCYDCIVKGIQNVNVLFIDVFDYDLRIFLDKLLNVLDIIVVEQVISEVKFDLVFDMVGIFQVIKIISDIVNFVQKIVNWYVLGRVQFVYDSFKEGFRILGVLGVIL